MISRERWARVQPILDAILDLPDDLAAAYLDRSCAADPELRLDVERLLAAAKQAQEHVGFLEHPLDRAAALVLSASASPSDPADPVGTDEFVGPYRIVRRIGSGGMGVVYLAHDTRLDRRVAVKLLPPWLAADASALSRFTEEAKAASALDHPNIATVYDVGAAGDAGMYIAMAYYDGETLEERIRRGPLPVEEASTIASQLAEGLRAAHAKEIVHRDIKPANVILTPEGVAKIVDFGVAKVKGGTLTAPGVTPGTVAYMSPEQTAGGQVDARTDIWAVGVVLYEMVTGRRPFAGDGPDAVIFAIRHDDPARIASVSTDAPHPLSGVIDGCLAKKPDERFTDAEALLAALKEPSPIRRSSSARKMTVARWTSAAAIALILGATVFLVRSWYGGSPMSAPAPHRIAVLPLRDAGANPANVPFTAGLTEELIARLAKIRGFSVIAHPSVLRYTAHDRNLPEIARALDVRSIVDGVVSVASDRVRVDVQLLDAASQERLWADKYEVPVLDLPTVQRNIIERVATALHVSIGSLERPNLLRGGSGQTHAYRSYLRGRYWLGKSDPASHNKALEAFQEALDLDPTYALAWVGLSDALDHLAGNGSIAANEAYPRARAAAQRALELDGDLAEGHASLAMALAAYDWRDDLAERHFRRAIELAPGYARAHRTYAAHLRNLCRLDEALAEARVGEALNPLDFFSHWETFVALYFGRRYDEALAHAQRLLDVNVPGANVMVGLARTQTREYDEALAALGEQPHAKAIRGHLYGMMGRHEDARRVLSALNATRPQSGFWRAAIHLGLNEPEEAIRALEDAYETRSWMLRLLKGEPIFDPLRSDPRFADLLRRIGFADVSPCSSRQ